MDELPPPMDATYGFAEYRSQVRVKGNLPHYERKYRIRQIEVPTSQLPDLKKLYRQIAEDEGNTAVLKQA